MDLIDTAFAFSPNVMKGKPKKKKASKTVSKLSLKNRSTPRPAPESRTALSERNGDVNSSDGSRQSKPSDRCGCRKSKENCQPCQCAQLITSDSSEAEDNVRSKLTASKQQQNSDLISEDEEIILVESDAKTTNTKLSSSTYVSCVSEQVRIGTVRRVIPETSSDEEVEELQNSFSRTLMLVTPENRSGVTSAINSCEKVEQWLKRIATPDDSVIIVPGHVSETSSSDDDGRAHSNAKESSSAYPSTQMSSRNSLSSINDSHYGTSRQSSSCDQNSHTQLSTDQLNFTARNVQQNVPVHRPAQHPPPSQNPATTNDDRAANHYSQSSSTLTESSDVFKVPRRSSRISKDRESIISSLAGTQSQATSTSTRSSSQYFVDKPPWSKGFKKQTTQEKKKPPQRFSTATSVSDLSDIREQNETFGSPKNKPDDDVLIPDTIPWPGSSNSHVSFTLQEQPHHKKKSSQEKDIREQNETFGSPRTKPDDDISIPDTLPWPDSSNSYVSSTPQKQPYQNNNLSQEKYFREQNGTTGSPRNDTNVQNLIVSPEETSFHLVYDNSVSARNSPQQNEPQAKIQSRGSLASSISLPDTLPWPDSSSSTSQKQPCQERNSSQEKNPLLRVPVPDATPVSSESDVFSWPLHSKKEIASILRHVEQEARKKDVSISSSMASTIPWPSDCDAPIYPPHRKYKSKPGTKKSSPQKSIEHEQTLTSIRSSAIFSNSQYIQVSVNENLPVSSVRTESNEIIESSLKNSNNTTSHNVSISQNKSIIEISSDSDSETDEQRVFPEDANDASDSEEESPFRLFRRRPDRASYVEIVVSETEEDEPEEKDTSKHSSSEKDSYSPKRRTKTLNRTPIQIPSSGSDSESSESVRGHRARNPTRINSSPLEIFSSGGISEHSSKSLISSDNEDSQKTYFTEGNGASRVQLDFDLPQISEDEEQPTDVAKRLDFEAESSSDEEAGRPSSKQTEPAKPARLSRTPQSPAQPRKRYTSSSPESSDNDERLEKFFENERKKREQTQRQKSSSSDDSPTFVDSPGFIVPDHAVEENSDSDFEGVKGTESPAFYLRLLNDKRRAEAEIDNSWLPGKEKTTTKTQKTLPTPTPTKGRQLPKTVGRPQPKPQYLGGTMFSPVLSFLASLSATNHQRCHPEAIPYVKRFHTTRLDLTARLFTMFNNKVFQNKLQQDMPITWNNRLSSTAGFCYNQRKPLPGGEYVRTSRIELSTKVISDSARLRDTLIHEMCHAATWVISGQLGGHGRVWKEWTWQARKHFPELPDIGRCHSYEVKTKYTYKCMECGYSFGRHSKSLDLERKRCGLCRGQFQLLVHGTPAKGGKTAVPRTPNVFAMFVSENYRLVKNNRKSLKHGDVMKMLSQKFAEHKIAKQ